MLKPNLKAAIRASFSAHASSYDGVSFIHRLVAQSLIDRLECEKHRLRAGPVLEIGCGTGHLSVLLRQEFLDRDLTLVDISEQMMERCRIRLLGARPSSPASRTPEMTTVQENQTIFLGADAEHLCTKELLEKGSFALIASSFTFHWFIDFPGSILQLIELLRPGGALYFSLPVQGTFKEWRRAATKAMLPFTANSFPTRSALAYISRQSRCQLDFEEVVLVDRFPDSSSFFTALKELGAAARIRGNTDNRIADSCTLRRLIRHWDAESTNGIEAHYHVILGGLWK